VLLEAGSSLSFASRADEVPGAAGDIDPQAIFDYAYHHFIPAPRTIFKGVRRLDAAHRMLVTGDGIDVARYWQPNFAPVDVPFATRQELFLSAIKGAVAEQVAGETVGCYLSGGTDSSTVTGMVTQVTGRPARTFSIGFDAEGYDEMEYARLAARHYGSDHHEYYITPRDLIDRIPDVASFFDQPFGNSSALPAFFCARLAHDAGVTRMLAGDGGDELFGGNSRYASDKLFTAYERVPAFLKSTLIEPLTLGLPLASVPVLRKGARYVEIARMPVPGRMQLYNLLTARRGRRMCSPPISLPPSTRGSRTGASSRRSPRHRRRRRSIARSRTSGSTSSPTTTCRKSRGRRRSAASMSRSRSSTTGCSISRSACRPIRRSADASFATSSRKRCADSCRTRSSSRRSTASACPSASGSCASRSCAISRARSVDALAARGIVVRGLSRTLFDERIGEHASYYGEMVWILMMLEQWLSRRSSF
jgi:asparagine synthase (glutamine-hydrolysing)